MATCVGDVCGKEPYRSKHSIELARRKCMKLIEDEKMKKLTKKQIVTIAISALIVIALIIASIVLGIRSNNTENKKDTDKKVESVEKEEKTEDSEDEKTENKEIVQNEDVVNEGVQNDVTTSNQTANNTGSTTKNETNANKNNTANKVSSSNKPSQTVTEPKPSHVHNWTEVKTQVAVPETGHYETIYGTKIVCNTCQTDVTSWSEEERREHYKKEPCRYGTVTTSRVEVGQEWVVDTPATTEARVTGYKCSCGATREKTQYAGMYTRYDKASRDRLEACKTLFKTGLSAEGCKFYDTSATYGYWESIVVCNSSSNGAWMWIFIREWPLDDYSYLQDGVKEGIIDQEEAKLVEAIYEEIPSLYKGCIERIAPEGGTELYNYVEKLIIQTDGDPDDVPYLDGAKGMIPENIPGLYVTIEETRGGFSLMFWAE